MCFRTARLTPGTESWQSSKWLDVSLDYQLIGNTGYNSDRGPANGFAIRLHVHA